MNRINISACEVNPKSGNNILLDIYEFLKGLFRDFDIVHLKETNKDYTIEEIDALAQVIVSYHENNTEQTIIDELQK